MKHLAPILLFVYNRPDHTKRVVESLQRNVLAAESKLFVFSDGAKNEKDSPMVQNVRTYLSSIHGFSAIEVVERDENWGLANNIMEGVTNIVNRYGRVIVLEDDLILSPFFLQFMNDALDIYQNEERVGHIHGCEFFMNDSLPETFLIKFVGSWGWGTWDRAWKHFNPDGTALLKELENRHLTQTFDFNNAFGFTKMLRRQIKGLNHSWAIRWNASLFLKDCYSLNVGKTLVQNTGFDGSGTHCGSDNLVSSCLYNQRIVVQKIEPIVENQAARKAIEGYYRKTYSFRAKAIRRIKRILKGNFGA